MKSSLVFSAAAAALLMLSQPTVSAFAAKPDMKMLDPDNDGTVSMDEAKADAAKKFGATDTDNDGTIDKKEAKAMHEKAGFAKVDTDKDGTIDKTEYMAAVEASFKKADKDNDGTLDAAELESPAGKMLVKMIQ